MDNFFNNTTNPLTLSCFNPNLSRNSVSHDKWMIFESFQDSAPGVAAVTILFFLIAFPWNLFIIVSILWKRLLKQPAHLLILNLAITDLLTTVFIMPINITSEVALEYIFGPSDFVRCQICQTSIIFTTLTLVSLHNIALLSLDRFLFIYIPMRYKKIVTVRYTIAILLAVWVLCIVLSIPPLFGFGELRLSTTIGNCFFSFFGETSVTRNIYYVLLILLEALIPLVILIVTNIWLLGLIHRHAKRIFKMRLNVNVSNSEKQQRRNTLQRKIHKKRNKQQLQLLRVFGAIFIANLVTWLPAIGLAISATAVDFDLVPAEVIAFAYLTYLSQSVIHPLLEAFFIQELRDIVKRWLYCCTCKWKQLKPEPSSRKGSSAGVGRQTSKAQGVDIPDSGERGHIFSCVCCTCLDECGAALIPDETSHMEVTEFSDEGTTSPIQSPSVVGSEDGQPQGVAYRTTRV